MSFVPLLFFALVAVISSVSYGGYYDSFRKVPGRYDIRQRGPGCPGNIAIPSYAETGRNGTNPFKIPHNRIIVDGAPCVGSGYLETWSSTSGKFLNSSFRSALNQSKSMQWFLGQCIVPWARYHGANCWFGRSISTTYCDTFKFRKQALLVFFHAPNTLTHPTLGVFPANTQNLFLLDGSCAYSVDPFAEKILPQNNDGNNSETSTATTKTPTQPPACFPGDANVELENGTSVPMRSLKVGDVVRVGRRRFEYSKVYLFTHRIPAVSSPFVRIDLRDRRTLRVSGGHYVYINDPQALVPAHFVRVGDYMDDSLVIRTERVHEEGLYNPQTLHGDIVVDRVQVSTYTEAMEPRAAHALLSALRCSSMMYTGEYN